ncbi:MAG TPA: SRPBCC family protein [Thermoleophilaceae bacterium]|nr:SRPBCC family protein [Thermoleophilaceae bacterium]
MIVHRTFVYAFRTAWRVAAPQAAVFEVLHASERWPEWWPGLESVVKLEEGDEDGRDSLGRYVWRAAFRYRVEFEMRVTQVERPHLLEGRASGDLDGVGSWRLHEEDGATRVAFDWRVSTTRRWMNALAPLARPVFRWNHDRLMDAGAEGLARRLGVELLSAGSAPVPDPP